MSHIYSCQYLNKEETFIHHEKIYNGKVSEQTEILKRFKSNMNGRNELKQNCWSTVTFYLETTSFAEIHYALSSLSNSRTDHN